MSIGSRIKQRREELNMTQPELAKIVGVSKGSIGNYESGVSSPNEKILFRLFDALQCDANFLYQDDMVGLLPEDEKPLSATEKLVIKKYRSLDQFGQETVNVVIESELRRCTYKVTELSSIEIPMSEYRASAGTGNWLDEEYNERVKVADTPQARRANIVIESVCYESQ